MTTVATYLDYADDIEIDVTTVKDVAFKSRVALFAARKFLETPGKKAETLRKQADLIDLPNTLVSVLGVLPYGIGTAIKQLDNVARSVAGTVDKQAAILETLDKSWAPTRGVVTKVETVVSTANTVLTPLKVDAQLHAIEAARLVASLGDQDIAAGTELARRLDKYAANAETWFATRDALLSPLGVAEAGFDAALAGLEKLLAGLDGLDAAFDSALATFKGAAKIANDILKSLDITIDLPWPFPDTNLLDVIGAIGSVFAVISGFVEGIVFGILRAVGVDIDKVFDGISDAMLKVLAPVFGAINALVAAAGALVDAIGTAVEKIGDLYTDILQGIGTAVGLGSLFDNTISGDGPDGVANIDDVLAGTAGEDAIYGLKGDDSLAGGVGRDFLFGGEDNDRIQGETGNDELFGGTGFDMLRGGAGADHLDGGAGRDTADYDGWEGNLATGAQVIDLQFAATNAGDAAGDTFASIENLSGSRSRDLIRGDDGDNSLWGKGNVDYIAGRGGNDRLYGGGSNDVLLGGTGADLLDGGADRDQVRYAYATAGVVADLANPGANTGEAAGDTYVDVEDLAGSRHADSLRGDGMGNLLIGGGGNDWLVGRWGDDTLNGGAGADTLVGGPGNDRLYGGNASDTFVFHAGHDVIADRGVGGHRDAVHIDDTLTLGLTDGAAVAARFGSVTGGNAVLDFGGGHVLTVLNVTDLADLGADILVF